MDRDEEFRRFVRDCSLALRRAAFALTNDHGHAEDLLQLSLITVYKRWERVRQANDPTAYSKRILYTTFVRSFRRPRVRELLGVEMDRAIIDDDRDFLEDKETLARAIAALPRRQRAVIVLRFYEDQSTTDVAKLLNCSVGTVKSQTSKALTKLRNSPNLNAQEWTRS